MKVEADKGLVEQEQHCNAARADNEGGETKCVDVGNNVLPNIAEETVWWDLQPANGGHLRAHNDICTCTGEGRQRGVREKGDQPP